MIPQNNREQYKISFLKFIKNLKVYEDQILKLNKYEIEIDYSDIRQGQYLISKDLYYRFKSLCLILNTPSEAALYSISRGIIDTYSVLYMISCFSGKEENYLRYLLYLLDAVRSRSNSLDIFTKNVDNLSKDSLTGIQMAKQSDLEAENRILDIIKQKKWTFKIDESNIQKSNWKYIDISGKFYKNAYNWNELYQIARIPPHLSIMFNSLYSSFIHGLGVSIMKSENDDKVQDQFTVDFFMLLIGFIIKINNINFPNELKEFNSKCVDQFIIDSSWELWNKLHDKNYSKSV